MYTVMIQAWFPTALEQTPSLYPNSPSKCVQQSPRLTANFSLSQRQKNYVIASPSKPKTQPKCSAPFLCLLHSTSGQSTSQSPQLFNFPRCTLPPVWLDQKDERALLTPRSRVLQNLTGSQLVKFPTFYGTRRFITAFTTARHLSVS